MNFFLVLLGIIIYNFTFVGKVSPNIYVAGVNIGGKTSLEAIQTLSTSIHPQEEITLGSEKNDYELKLKNFVSSYDFVASVQNAYNLTRTGNTLYDLNKKAALFMHPQSLGLVVKINEQSLKTALSVISGEVSSDPVYPSANIIDGHVAIEKGKPGTEVDIKLLRATIGYSLSYNQNQNIKLPLREVNPSLNETQAKMFEGRAEKYVGKSLVLSLDGGRATYKDADLVSLLDPKEGFNQQNIDEVAFDIASRFNAPPQNPKFIVKGGKVEEFSPSKNGLIVQQDKLKEIIVDKLVFLAENQDVSTEAKIPATKTPPEVSTGQTNNLGIETLIGKGVSHFSGSITSRIYNITLAASRLNGILIAPGETFSFNSALGDVSKLTGYKEAYVIKDGRTVLGDGGGVCQVSTTFFRAALNAGLSISERHAHSYRVGYYEQGSPPGIDATVYSPSADLKVVNDTPGYILIQTKVDPKSATLAFDLYGTDDGRVATTSKPIVSGLTAPPEDLYIDDPTLAAGVIKQIDWKAKGAKVKFDYRVKRGDKVLYEKSFYSNYRPWQSVYLRGTGPAF